LGQISNIMFSDIEVFNVLNRRSYFLFQWNYDALVFVRNGPNSKMLSRKF